MRYYNSPLESQIVVIKKLRYLDLASGINHKFTLSPELKSLDLPLAVGHLDLALPKSTIIVPNGKIMTFNRTILKLQGSCGKLVLFPNLPGEIQSEIFDLCAALNPRQIKFTETETIGEHRFKTIGGKRPFIFRASKPALLDALVRNRYVPMFGTIYGNRRPYFCVGRDIIELSCQTVTALPVLELIDTLTNTLDMSSIRVIHLDLDLMMQLYIWVATNLALLPSVKVLHVTATLNDPGRAERGTYVLEFKEVWGNRNAFMQFCKTPHGKRIQGRAALSCFSSYISSAYERGRINAINVFLNYCLNFVPNFPLEVAVILEYLPFPGAPLARKQPRIQQI